MRICVLDTETTGRTPDESCEVVEVAWCCVDSATGRVGGWTTHLCGIAGEMPPTARAVHHISPEELVGQPALAERIAGRDWSRVDAFAAHNAAYDRPLLERAGLPGRPWICTYRVALHLWPDAPAFGNQTLRYWLDVQPAWPEGAVRPLAGQQPHRALYDVCVTAGVLARQLEVVVERAPHGTVSAGDTLIRYTQLPVLLKTCRFGKHRGMLWSEVPKDYLRWMLRTGAQMDDEDVRHTVRHYLDLPG